MSAQPDREPDWRTVATEVQRYLIGSLGAPRDWLEDAVQDAMLCMIVLARRERIEDAVAFGVAFVKKRWIDELRKRQRRGEELRPDLDEPPGKPVHKVGTPDWSTLLRDAGWEPTEAWSRILDAIASGARGNSKIAATLGVHVKTVQESRKRLQRWLKEKMDPPPPL